MNDSTTPLRLCKNCGIEYPLTNEFWHKDKKAAHDLSYKCKECAKAKARQWAADNSERNKENCRTYYRENKEAAIEYRHKNADKIAKWKREWRKNNPEKVKRYKADSQRRHPNSSAIRIKRHYAKYPEKRRMSIRIQQSRRRHAEGRHTKQDIYDLHEMQNDLCAYCGIRLHGKYHVDHIIPVSKGGSNWPDNLALACPHCNQSKNDKPLSEWTPW